MPVSGLVLTLSSDAERTSAAISELRSHPSIVIGDLAGPKLPIVVDTPTSEDDRAVWEWLHSLPGIRFVELVCADVSADTTTNPSPERRPRERSA
jgi:hypothetical protein